MSQPATTTSLTANGFFPFLAAMILTLVQRLLVGFLPCDDAFIAYRFAHHLVHGGYLVFNPGDPVFGCTTLSYAFLLAALHGLGIPMITASWILTLVADAVVCALLVRLGQVIAGRPWLGVVAAFLWLVHPVIGLNAVSGMETSLFTGLMLAFVLACQGGRFGLGLVLIALLVWTRIDGVAAFPVWLYAWWKAGRPVPAAPALAITVGLAALYAAFTLSHYGTLVPQSAVAKAASHGASPIGVMLMAASYVGAVAGVLSVWYWFVTPHLLLLAGLGSALGRFRRLEPAERLTLLMALTHAAVFILPGRAQAQLYPWYYVPFLTLLLVPALHGLLSIGGWIERGGPRPLLLGAGIGLAGGAGLAAFSWALWAGRDHSTAPIRRLLPQSIRDFPPRYDRMLEAVTVNTALWIGLMLLILVWVGLERRWPLARAGARKGVGLVLTALTLFPFGLNLRHISEKYERREASYLNLGRWASEHLDKGEWIAAQEIGAIGWGALELKLYDELGLVTVNALSVRRKDYVARLRPAFIANVSTISNLPIPARDIPPGYVALRVGHNQLLLREDLKAQWDESPPELR